MLIASSRGGRFEDIGVGWNILHILELGSIYLIFVSDISSTVLKMGQYYTSKSMPTSIEDNAQVLLG